MGCGLEECDREGREGVIWKLKANKEELEGAEQGQES